MLEKRGCFFRCFAFFLKKMAVNYKKAYFFGCKLFNIR